MNKKVAGSRRNLSAEIRRVSGETITVRYRRYKAKKWRWVDATGHPVTYTWLNMALVAAPFPITASRPPWASASGRGGKELIDQNIKGGVR